MEPQEQRVRVAVVDRPLSVSDAYSEVGRPDAGAVAVFVGTARDHSPGKEGVVFLEYEAFDERVVAAIEEIVAEANERWPVLSGVVEHRVGKVDVGQPAVIVAIATAHRADAFDAARYLIDELKQRAPLWKKEHWSGGAEWGEGA